MIWGLAAVGRSLFSSKLGPHQQEMWEKRALIWGTYGNSGMRNAASGAG